MIWTPEKQLGFPTHDATQRRSSRALSRWFRKAWPPNWGWGSWVPGCGCCGSSASSSSQVPKIFCQACNTEPGLPLTLHVTVSAGVGTPFNSVPCCWDGQTYPATWDAVQHAWITPLEGCSAGTDTSGNCVTFCGSNAVAGKSFQFSMTCDVSGNPGKVTIKNLNDVPNCGASAITPTCNPFIATLTGCVSGGACCHVCQGQTWTVTVTE
jgi:hypothetical protein